MNSKIKSVLSMGTAVLGMAAAVYFGYQWFFCRFYVPAGCMAVVTAKTGDAPANGVLLVERGQKGIWRDVLAEGRHFLDPIQYDVSIVKALTIPLGKVGIVTSKVGKELPPGQIISEIRDSKGVWRDVLGPGSYRLNPQGYSVELVPAVNIPAGYAGVVTSQTGAAPKPGEFARVGEKGVLKDILQPGLYYLNRYAYTVNVFEVGMNQVTMSGSANASVMETKNRLVNANDALVAMETMTLSSQNELRKQAASRRADSFAVQQHQKKSIPSKMQIHSLRRPAKSRKTAAYDRAKRPASAPAPAPVPEAAAIFGLSRAVEFPSRDGFKVTLDMTVEFELMPEKISKIYLLYGDLPQVVEKIILPQVLSVSRMKGSSYQAQDFIMGEGRETFQLDLQKELSRVLAAKSIIVHNAIIRNVEIPLNILTPIRSVSIAREQNLTNISMQESAKKLAELNTETELIEQRCQEVEQNTAKLVAQTGAERDREVASLNADTKLQVAGLALEKSKIEAKIAKLRGENKVQCEFLVNNARAEGEQLRAKVLGNAGLLADLALIENLNPKVQSRIIYAGTGTLWTDLKNAAIPLPASRK